MANSLVARRIVVGISGASGFQYAIQLLQTLRAISVETHLFISKSAHRVRESETAYSAKDVIALADVHHNINDIACSLSSGSFHADGMIIAPCSMKTLADIAHGLSSNAMTRVADVMLKERRRLVLMVRETPLHLVHLRNMQIVTEMGGIIAPPVPAFYNQPQSLEDIIQHSVGRVLDLFGIDTAIKRWQ